MSFINNLKLVNKTTIIGIHPKTEYDTSQVHRQPRAYIITSDCNSARFNVTKGNIEGVLPRFFHIHCFRSVPLTDPRVHTHPILLWKKFSSNLLSFVDIWTYEIPKYSQNEYGWTFIFEDDVNFNDPKNVHLSNYNEALSQIMNNPEVQQNDGFLYLGICGPTYDPDNRTIISENTNNTLVSRKGLGFCLHATGITTNRARLLWSEIASYRPSPNGVSLDLHFRNYLIRSGKYYFIFGTNFLYPPGTGHFGIAFQDRGRFSTSIG